MTVTSYGPMLCRVQSRLGSNRPIGLLAELRYDS